MYWSASRKIHVQIQRPKFVLCVSLLIALTASLVDLLKANGIIPVPAPLKRKASQEIIDLTVNDVQAGSSRSNDLVRGEHNSQRTKETERKSKKVKQEQKPGVFVEVIDLT